MKIPRSTAEGTMEVKMTPMIDVVFLLLIFFVWTSSFEIPEFDLPSALAEPPPGGSEANSAPMLPVEVFDEIVVKLIAQNESTLIRLNGQPVADTSALRAQLKEIMTLGVQPPVIVDPDDQVTMDQAVAVYDVARSAGADRVLFAARADATIDSRERP